MSALLAVLFASSLVSDPIAEQVVVVKICAGVSMASNDVTFYEQRAKATATTVCELIGEFAHELPSTYTAEETAALFTSLRRVVSATRNRQEGLSHRTGHSADSAILYLDPTCDVCAEVITLIARARAAAPEVVPPLDYRPVAAPHQNVAYEAAVALVALRETNPERFDEAVEEFATRLPSDTRQLAALVQEYVTDAGVSAAAIAAARHKVDAEHARMSKHRLHPPALIYRDVHLTLDTESGFGAPPFDPLHNETALILALRMLGGSRD